MDCRATLAKTTRTVITKECNDCGDPYLIADVDEAVAAYEEWYQ